MQWRPFQAGVREDGSLWIWDNMPENVNRHDPLLSRKLQRMGTETNWVTVAGDHWSGFTLVALKADGTLWRWEQKFSYYAQPVAAPALAARLPKRMGKHNDWVAVCGDWGGFVSLAADGSLWYWRDRDMDAYERDGGQPLLGSSKRPVKIGVFLARNRRGGWGITRLTDAGGGFNHRRQ